MSIFDIIYGAGSGFGGVLALAVGLSGTAKESLPVRIFCVSFGVAFLFIGIFHFSEGVGASWATPQLWSTLKPWFAIPCFAAFFFAWFTDRSKKR